MSTQQRWIALFALLVLGYGISQYWAKQRSSEFRAVLLDFLPKDVQRIDIRQGQEKGFSILRQADRWLLSGPHINEEAKAEPVAHLLKRLQAIRTEEVVSQSAKDWEDYGVKDGQGLLLCLHYNKGDKDCVRIGRYAYAEEEARVELYTRLQNQREVYVINGLPLSFLDGKSAYFRNHTLLQIEDPLRKLRLESPQGTLEVSAASDSSWTVNSTETFLKDAYWNDYLAQLQHLQGYTFADDIDELSLDSMLAWQMHLYTDRDSFQLNCYSDTTRQLPLILHSNQHARTWISSDTNGLAEIILMPLQKWMTYEQ